MGLDPLRDGGSWVGPELATLIHLLVSTYGSTRANSAAPAAIRDVLLPMNARRPILRAVSLPRQ